MTTQTGTGNTKIPLPQFIKIFTSNAIPVPKAMAFTGKVYKEYNTPDTLAQLDEPKLKTLGIDSGEDAKLVLSSLRRAGYTTSAAPKAKKVKVKETPAYTSVPTEAGAVASGSTPAKSRPKPVWTPSPRKRVKRSDDTNEFITPSDEIEEEDESSLRKDAYDFAEVTDEELLKLQHVVINRAPVMMAWATIVAERLNFTRDEALSIASVYTEMNAKAKGAVIGIYTKSQANVGAMLSGSQPYVDLMGRRIPLYRHQNGRWRALANGKPAVPASAFGYILRSFRQTMPFIIGAMKLLAGSYPTAQELNQKGFSLYAEFRPASNEWGSRSEVHCKTLLDLRCPPPLPARSSAGPAPAADVEVLREQAAVGEEASVKLEAAPEAPEDVKPQPSQRRKFASVEEYEAFLDEQDQLQAGSIP